MIKNLIIKGIKTGEYGLGLLYLPGAKAFGLFTKNSIRACPLLYTQKKLRTIEAVVVNSGNANAFTGTLGFKNTKKMAHVAAKVLRLNIKKVGVSSTGIIGKQLDMSLIEAQIHEAAKKKSSITDFASAIMTTDTKKKIVHCKQGSVEILGICKGSGMISPNMATMLAFIVTNMCCDYKTLKKIVDETFNCITIDGDTSTNDAVLMFSTCTEKKNAALLKKVCSVLAKKIVEDGEGLTKTIEVIVKGAKSVNIAKKAAKKVANSLLVKTAINGEKPNWGRIVAAVGSAVRIDTSKLSLMIKGNGKIMLIKRGSNLNNYEKAKAVMKSKKISIVADLGNGIHYTKILTCDLSKEYVHINAGYN